MISTPRGLWLWGAFAAAVFTILLVVRLEFFRPRPGGDSVLKGRGPVAVRPGETWMAIHQNRKRIGFSHRIIERTGLGYRVVEKTVMKINTMGMVQDLVVTSESDTEPDFSLRSFDFEVVSGRFRFQVAGRIENSLLRVTTRANNDDPSRPVTIPLETRPYLSAGIVQAMGASGLAEPDRVVVFVFDPVTMGQVPVTVRVMGHESLLVMGKTVSTKKLSFKFKGVTQHAWVDGTGRVVKEEGILGMSLTLTSREEALEGAVGGDDLTLLASVAPNRPIEDPQGLTRLEVKISGIDMVDLGHDDGDPGMDLQNLDLDGGRQSFAYNRLTIIKERLPGNHADDAAMAAVDERFLAPGPFIRSDHPGIVSQAGRIEKSGDTPLEKIRAVLRWMDENIEKRPVLSMPDAVSTLRNRMGDCNEHAVLFAALCRALGIPARVEAGLVYLNHRFYYHAWNGVYLGRWITVDSLFNQLPADVTHIRLASGAGGRGLGLGMVGVMGRIKLEIVGEGR
ncbi:MAG: transglutaminase domain-containing protein [Desulfobacteraceae bacterium]|nr:transglutaminase domain-containing protein [Desulfobacteraceae bacterium]